MEIFIILLAASALVLVINTIAFLVKEPVKEAESDSQLIEPHYSSKQLFGYISGFMLPINCLVTFLTGFICDHFRIGGTPGDFAPPPAFFYALAVFISLLALGGLLGIIGFIIVPPEELTRRYKIISWVGLLSNGLPVVLTVVWIVLIKYG